MAQRKLTLSKNRRDRRRQGRNEFWVVLDSHKGSRSPVMYCRKPYKEKVFDEYREYYEFDWSWWSSYHDDHYPNNDSGLLDRITGLSKTEPIRVKLIIYSGEKPDFYIQRVGENLYMSSHLSVYYIGGNRNRKVVEVPHGCRISNKLFPDVVDESGIVGVRIVKF